MKNLNKAARGLLLAQLLSGSIFLQSTMLNTAAFGKCAKEGFGQVTEEVVAGKSYSVSREVVKARPEQVWQILTDFPNAHKVFPQVKKCEMVEDRGMSKVVKHTITPSGCPGSFTYVLELKETPNRAMEWHRISGDFKEVDGSWRLEPIDGGHNTLVTYSSHVTGGLFMPGALIRRQARIDMPQVMVSLRNQVESVQIAGKPSNSQISSQ